LGYVWVEDGRVIGSVSMQRAAPRSNTWLVANVAVHPDHRRRGIARQLMQATLDSIRGQAGAAAILQVDDDNLGAINLYRQLGFGRVTTRMNWTRPGYAAPPAYEPGPVDIRLRGRGEWAAQLRLAQQVSPEGLAWSKPLREADFQTTPLAFLDQLVTGRYVEHWVAGTGPEIVGSIIVNTGIADGDRLHLLVHPDHKGKLERPLLARGLRRLGRRPWVARLEYDAEDSETARVLRDLGFQGGRILRWMRVDLK
jgi:L-amino acid N-acyltransferase YncA